MKKTYVVTDAGIGDGGKGTVVHKIATMKKAHTIIKFGGAQGQHGVTTSRGEKYAFSQWGCGTFEGIKTHISSRMVISPVGILNEADKLRYICGIHEPYELLTVDESAICATVFHGIASRLKELARGENPRGTVGTGVGEAYRYLLHSPELTIRAGDLARSDIKDRLAAVRDAIRQEIRRCIHESQYLPKDCKEVSQENNLLYDDDFLEYAALRCREVASRTKIVDTDYLRREILSQPGITVIERSHGVLGDCYHGFHPHTSALRTLPVFVNEILEEIGFDGQVINLLVHRAYSIRHGAGPMPTDNPEIAEHLLPGSQNDYSRYRGEVRVGPLDLVLLRYAIEVCGGSTAFDGIAITWFDQIQANKTWQICDRYQGTEDRNFFTPTGEIKVRRGTDIAQLNHQEALGKQLMSCTPEITTLEVPSTTDRKNLFSFCADVLQQKIDVKVKMVSFGPTERDKICK